MRSLVSFIFVSLTAVLLSSCGGGGGGGGDGARPSPVDVVDVYFEEDIQGEMLKTATDTINDRAKDANGDEVDPDKEVVVRDVGLQSSRSLSDGLVGFALPLGGCTVISNGRYTNYLTSYRQGTEGELDCLPSCSGVSRAVVTQGYRILLCVAAAEDTADSLVFEAGECKGDKVVQFDKRGCQTSRACMTSGYKVESDACVAKVSSDCNSGEQGFHAGKCVATPQDATQCQAVGKVLQFDTRGCQPSGACTTSGYKVVSDNTCVAKEESDCNSGEQGFANGKCVAMPQDAGHCQAVGKVLQFDTEGCESARACKTSGYKVESGACVASSRRDCTGEEQGFDSSAGKCVAMPQDAGQCQAVGKVLQFDMEGCESARACKTSGYKVESGACVASSRRDCTGEEQGFDSSAGKCVAQPTNAQQCGTLGRVLQLDGEGCQTIKSCTKEGYKIGALMCVPSTKGDCRGRQGFDSDSGQCITATTAKHCTDRGAFVLNKAMTGCQTVKACTRTGYKAKSGACVAKVGTDCTGDTRFRVGQVCPSFDGKALHGKGRVCLKQGNDRLPDLRGL